MNNIDVVTLTVFLLICKGSALLCNVCQSLESWEDCDGNGNLVDCSSVDPEFDICFKVHRATEINDSEIHIYTKSCGFHEQCNGEQCKEYGDWCQVNCCNMDECNASEAVGVTYMLYVLVGMITAFHLG